MGMKEVERIFGGLCGGGSAGGYGGLRMRMCGCEKGLPLI